MILKKLTFIFSIAFVLALISGCDNDPRPTRAYYHYEELEQKDNDEQKDDEEEEKEEEEEAEEDSAKLQDFLDKMLSEGMSTVIDGQDPNDITKFEKMIAQALDG